MSYPVEIQSLEFLLQREDDASALRALKKLAREWPEALDCPEDVLSAKTLDAALEEAFWKPTRDANGDLVHVRYQKSSVRGLADDFPRELFARLAKHARHLQVELVARAEPDSATIYMLELGRYIVQRWSRSRLVLERAWTGLRGAPGDVVDVPVRVTSDDGSGARDLAMEVSSSTADCEIEYDRSTFAPGEARDVRIRIGQSAIVRLHVTIVLTSAGRLQQSVDVGIDVDGLEPRPRLVSTTWSAEPGRRSIFLHHKQHQRSLRDMQRFAARHLGRADAEFLSAVHTAPGLADALRAAHLEPTFDAAGHLQRLELSTDTLPGDERSFRGLLASFADRVHDGGALDLVFAKRPERVVSYRMRRSGLYVEVRPRSPPSPIGTSSTCGNA